MIGLSELRYFMTVAKTSNVSRAAELCGISQPALSQSLKRLEDTVGAQLLNRSKTGVRLTRAGERFAAQGKELMERWENLAQTVKATDSAVSGHFKIGCHPSVAIYALPHFLRGLQERNPELHFSMVHGLSREIANDVIEWRVDFGLVINPPKHPDLVIREIGTDEVTLWASKEKKPPAVLIYDPGLLQTQNLLKQLEKRGLEFPRRLESSNLEVISALTHAGCGVGILPTRVARNPLAGKPLQVYSPKAPVFKDRLCLIFRAGAQTSSAGRAIVDAILAAEI